MCRQKDAKTVQGCALKTRSPCCAGYGFRFFGYEKSESVLHADGLQRCLRRIFIAAALERRTANHHPCPLLGGGERPPLLCKLPAPLTITTGQRLTVFASPNTPSTELPPCTYQPIRAPFPPRERGWGERADTPVATLGAILCAVRIDF